MIDAVVVGAGPNGLAAALTLAAAGLQVRVIEGAATPGGGCRTESLTLPGFAHDVCSAVHPLAVASPFFAWFDLEGHGVRLRYPEVAYAQALEAGRAAAAYQSLDRTVAELGAGGPSWRHLFAPLVAHAEDILSTVLSPLRRVPHHPLPMVRFGFPGLRSAATLADRLDGDRAKALLGGAAGHAMLPLGQRATGALGLLLCMLAHAVGWPVVEG